MDIKKYLYMSTGSGQQAISAVPCLGHHCTPEEVH